MESSPVKSESTPEQPQSGEVRGYKPLTPEQRATLDAKYGHPENMHKFTVYFGRYKEQMTFEELVNKDASYARFMCRVEPCTNNIHLFQKYVRSMHPMILCSSPVKKQQNNPLWSNRIKTSSVGPRRKFSP